MFRAGVQPEERLNQSLHLGCVFRCAGCTLRAFSSFNRALMRFHQGETPTCACFSARDFPTRSIGKHIQCQRVFPTTPWRLNKITTIHVQRITHIIIIYDAVPTLPSTWLPVRLSPVWIHTFGFDRGRQSPVIRSGSR